MSKMVHVVRKDGTTFDVDFEGYEFSIIYSADCVKDEDVADMAPPAVEDWDETEDDGGFEYGYLEGKWEDGHHRKWCTILDLEKFEKFLAHCYLHANETPTMGSIGAPGFGVGCSPAVAFDGWDTMGDIRSAYVTPIPPEGEVPPSWDEVEQAMWERYKHGSPFPEFDE